MYHVHILESASRELARLDKTIGRRIVQRINWLAENLNDLRPEPLTGDLIGFYKLRVGDYRVIYEMNPKGPTVILHAIGHRRETYKKKR